MSTASPTSSPSSQTAESSGSYKPLAPKKVMSLDISCPSPTMSTWKSQSFSYREGKDLAGFDIIGIMSYTIQECIDACSTYNHIRNANLCRAAVLLSDMHAAYFGDAGANCFLKDSFNETNASQLQRCILAVLLDPIQTARRYRAVCAVFCVVCIFLRSHIHKTSEFTEDTTKICCYFV